MEYKQLNIFDYFADNFTNSEIYEETIKEKFEHQTRKQKRELKNTVTNFFRKQSDYFNFDLETEEWKKATGTGKAEELLKNLEHGFDDLKPDKNQFRFNFDKDNNIIGWSNENGVSQSIDNINISKTKSPNVSKIKDINVASMISKYKIPLAIVGGLAIGSLLFEDKDRR